MTRAIHWKAAALLLLACGCHSYSADPTGERGVGLRPELGPFHWVNAYDELQIHRISLLGGRLDPNALATALIVGSKVIEAVSVERVADKGSYAVRVITSKIKENGIHEIREQSAELSQTDAQQIHGIWAAALAKTRVWEEPPVIADALEYHFGAHVGNQLVCGRATAFDEASVGAEVWKMISIVGCLSSIATCPAHERDQHLKKLHSVLK